MTENQIIKGLRENDPKTVQYVVEQYFSMIKKMVTETGGGRRQDAEDVFMEGLEVLFLRFQSENFVLSCSVSTFLYRVCRYKWINQLRRKKIHQIRVQESADVQLLEEEFDLHEIMAEHERVGLLRSYFQKLEQACRQLLDLFLQELPLNQIMQRTGISSEGYLRKRKFLCKQRLFDMIRKDARFKELIEKMS